MDENPAHLKGVKPKRLILAQICYDGDIFCRNAGGKAFAYRLPDARSCRGAASCHAVFCLHSRPFERGHFGCRVALIT
jgi:hypothetical protein